MSLIQTAVNSSAWLIEEDFRREMQDSICRRIMLLNRNVDSCYVVLDPQEYSHPRHGFSVSMSSQGDTILTYIANNTCYLELDKSKTPLYEYTFTTEDDPDASLLGDVDNNGVVNITDVMLTTNYVIGKTPSVFIFENADINKDTTITITDVMFIVNIILGK